MSGRACMEVEVETDAMVNAKSSARQIRSRFLSAFREAVASLKSDHFRLV